MYTLIIKSWKTHSWHAYVEYLDNTVYNTFPSYLLNIYPEIVKIEEDNISGLAIRYFQMTITFQSEEHYHWFLLKQ